MCGVAQRLIQPVKASCVLMGPVQFTSTVDRLGISQYCQPNTHCLSKISQQHSTNRVSWQKDHRINRDFTLSNAECLVPYFPVRLEDRLHQLHLLLPVRGGAAWLLISFQGLAAALA